MARKDFHDINIDPVYNTIAEATETYPGQQTQDTQDAQGTEQHFNMLDDQIQEEQNQLNNVAYTVTKRGRLKLKRINMAFSPLNYDYVTTMARVRGQTVTAFVNHIISQSLKENQDIYSEALRFRNSL